MCGGKSSEYAQNTPYGSTELAKYYELQRLERNE